MNEPVGGVASRLIVIDALVVLPALSVAEQLNVVPLAEVSDVMFDGPQPVELAMPDVGSVTVQVSATLVVYQPLLPTVPIAFATTEGAVLSTVTVRVGEVKALPALSVVTTRRSYTPSACRSSCSRSPRTG